MIQTATLAFMGLDEAAEALGIHPNNLSTLAKAGKVPAAKVGRAWRFLDVDLAEYLRAQYAATQPAPEPKPCRSTNVAKRGGSTSSTRSPASEFEKALGLPIVAKRNAMKTSDAPNFGEKPALHLVNEPGTTPAPPG